MSYYLPSLLSEQIGLCSHTAQLVPGINAIAYLVFSSIAVSLVERWGRRNLMIISTAADGTESFATASIPFFFIYYIAFDVCMLEISWLYPTEMNSIAMRTKGAATATTTNWITNYATVQMTPPGIDNLGWRFWIVFTVFNAAFMPIIYFFYPETANRTLEYIDEYYHNDPPLIVTKEKDAISSKRPLKYVQKEEETVEVARRESVARCESIQKDGPIEKDGFVTHVE